MKHSSEGKPNDEFVGLKSKMHSIKNIDGQESNTAKVVNIVTNFNEFKVCRWHGSKNCVGQVCRKNL